MPPIQPGLMEKLMKTGARLFAPDSLMLPDEYDNETASPQELRAVDEAASHVQPGDIILVTTPGPFYSFWRSIAASGHDHAVVVVSETHCMHVGPPRARKLLLKRLLFPKRKPTIFRPKLTEEELKRFMMDIEWLENSRYNIERAVTLLLKLAFKNKLHVNYGATLRPAGDNTSSWICTDAVMVALCRSSAQIRAAAGAVQPPLDMLAHGSCTLTDVSRLAFSNPELLQHVHLPVRMYDSDSAPPPASETGASAMQMAGKARRAMVQAATREAWRVRESRRRGRAGARNGGGGGGGGEGGSSRGIGGGGERRTGGGGGIGGSGQSRKRMGTAWDPSLDVLGALRAALQAADSAVEVMANSELAADVASWLRGAARYVAPTARKLESVNAATDPP
jgi:uncharacterized membrane protein YgcG